VTRRFAVALALGVLAACSTNGAPMPTLDEVDRRARALVVEAMEASGIADAFEAVTSSGNVSPCGAGDDPGDPVQVRYVVAAPPPDDPVERTRAAVEPWTASGAELVDEPTGPQLAAFTGSLDGFHLSAVALPDQVGIRVESPCVPLPDGARVGVPPEPILPT
jgi:hypothetical protein